MLGITSLWRKLFYGTRRPQATRVFFAVLCRAGLTPVIFYTRVYARVGVRVIAREGGALHHIGSTVASAWTKHRRLIAVTAAIAVILTGVGTNLARPVATEAAVSDNLNFQARLEGRNGAIVNDGNYNVEFKLYNTSSGGSPLWTETYLNSNSQGIRVINGYLSANLGSVNPFPNTISWNESLYITMNIGGTTTGSVTFDGEMNPRLKLTAVPYAFQAKSADQLQVSNNGFVSTLSFTSPTQNNSIILPDAGGTVCLVNSSTCGFASSSGSSNYIQNGATLQGNSNFHIQSAGTGTITAHIQALTGQTADLLRFSDDAGNALGGFNAAGQLYYQSGSFTGTLVQDSLAQNTVYHLPDPGGSSATICLTTGNCAGTGGGITGTGNTNYVARFNSAGTINASSLLYDNNSFIGVNTTTNNGQLSVVSGNASQAGVFVQAAANATKAALVIRGGATPGVGGDLLQLQDATGNVLARFDAAGNISTSGTLSVTGDSTLLGNVNVTSGSLTVGVAGSVNGGLVLANSSNSFTTSLVSPTLSKNQIIAIPATNTVSGNDTVCLLNLSNCVGAGGSVSTSGGVQNYITKYTNAGASQLGNSALYDDGSFVGLNTTTNSGLLSIQGAVAGQSSLFVHGAGSATSPVTVIRGGATPGSGADLLQLQTDNGSVVAKFDAAGNLTAGTGTFGGLLTANGGLSAGGNIAQTGSGTFSTGTGAVSLNGATSIGSTLTVSGATTLNGNVSVSGTNNLSVGTGTVTFGSLGAGLVQASSGGLLSSGSVDRNSSALFGSILTVANGGTGAGSFTANGIVYGNGTGALQVTATATNSVLITGAGGVPTLSQTLPAAVQGNITQTGALGSGSIGNGFGAIATTDAIGTTAGLQGGTLSVASGAFTVDGSGIVTYVPSGTGGANLVCQNASGQLATCTNTYATTTGNDFIRNSTSQQTSANFNIKAQTGTVAATIQGAAGQDMAVFVNATGTTVAKVDAAGNLTAVNGTFNGTLNATGATTLGNTLGVTGLTTLSGGASVANGLTVTNGGATITAGGLTISAGGASITGTTNIAGSTAITGSNTFTVGTGATALGGTLGVTGAATLHSTLGVTGATTLGATLDVTGNTTVGGSLAVTGTSTFTGLVTASGGIANTGNYSQTGSGTFSTGTGAVSLNGNVNISGVNTLTVGTGAVAFGGTLGVTGATTLGDTLTVTGATTLSDALDVSGATLLGDTLGVTGLTTLSGGANITGATAITGATTITGTTNINTTGTAGTSIGNSTGAFSLASSGLNITSAGAVSGVTTLSASGAISAATSGNTINGLVINSGALSAITGYAQASGNFAISGTGTFSTGTGAVSLNGNTSVTGSNTFTVGTGAVKFGSLGAGVVQSDASGLLSSGSINVANGGTGAGSFTLNGILYGNGTGAIQATASAINSVLTTDASGVPTLSQTLPAAVQGNISTVGALTGGSIGTGFGAISTANDITTTTTVKGATLNATGALQLNGANINTAGTLTNVAYLNQANGFTAANTFSANGTALTVTHDASIGGTATVGTLSATTASVSGTGTIGTLSVTNNGTISGTGTIGTLSVTNAATVGSGLTVTAGGATITAGGLTVSAGGASITGATNIAGNTAITGSNTFTVGTGATSLGGTLGVTGLTSLSGGATINGATTLNGSTTISGTNNFTVGTGTVTLGSLGAGVVQSDASGVLSSGNISVANGGTGASSFTLNGILFGNGTGAIQATASANNSILATGAGGVPSLVQTLPAAVQGNITATGILATGSIASGFGTISTGNDITTTTTVKGATVNATSALQLNGVNINTAGTLTNVAYLNQANGFTAANTFSANGTALTVTHDASIGGTGTIGTLSVTNAATIGTGLTVTAGGATITAGGLTVSAGGASITGATNIAGNTAITGSNTFTVGTGATSLGGTLGVTGNATLGGTLGVTGASTFTGSVTANGGITNTGNYSQTGTGTFGTGTGAVSLNGNTSVTGSNTFSVGTGATNLGGTLGVTGNTSLGGTLGVTGAATLSSTLNVTGAITGSATIQGTTVNGTTGINTGAAGGTQRIDASGNLVNIGTITSGLINGQTISSAANFTGTLTVAGATTLSSTLGVTGNATLGGTLTVTNASTFNGQGTFNSGLSVAGGSSFNNASSTIFSALTVSNRPTGGAIGTAAATVDVATTININQTTANQSLTLPSPTDTTAGRILYVNNIGSTDFTIGSVTLSPGASASYIWNGSLWVALTTGTSSSGVTTIGTIDGQPKSSNGAVISGASIFLQTADASNVGLVSTGVQTFAGDKTFSGAVTVSGAATLSSTLSVTGNTTLGGTLSVASTSTFTGQGTFNGGLVIANNSNFSQTGTGTFSTGTGGVTLNGNTSVSGSRTFTVGTGATSLGGTLGVTGLTTLSGGATVTGATTLNGNVNISGTNTLTVGIGTVTLGSLGAGVVQSDASGVLSSGNITVANGGTGAGSFTLNGILYGNGTGAIQSTASANNSILATNGSGVPSLVQTLPAAVQGNITATGILGTGSIASGFGTISTGNDITTTTTVKGATVNATSALQLNGANINTAGTLTNVAYLNQANTFTAGGTALTVNNNATISGTATIGTLSVTNNGSIGGTGTIGTLSVTNSATIGTGLTVTAGGATITAGGLTVSAGGASITGATNIAGNTAVTGTNTFTVGSGATSLGGTLGVTGATTLTGLLTANGGVTNAGNYSQTGTGTFSTGTGAVTLNGNTSISGTNTLTVGTGATSLGGTLGVTGLTTLSGGATISGATTITGAVNINTTGTANTVIGNSTGTFSLASSGLNVTTAGALSGITTLSASGAITAATSGNTINGLVINSGALSAITGYAQASGNFAISGTGTFSTGTGAVSLNGATSVTGSNTFTVGTGTVTLGSLGAGVVQSNASGVLSSGNINVANGGTGASTFTLNGILFGNGTGAIQATSAANSSILATGPTGVPALTQTLPSAVQGNITATGILATGSIASGFGTISTGNDITTTTTVKGATVNATSALQLNGTNINTAGTLTNVAYLNQANNFSAANTFSALGTGLTVNNNATISGTGTIGTLSVTNAATIGTGLTVTAGGATITAGGLTVTAGGASITGATNIAGNTAVTGTNTFTVGTGATALGGTLTVAGTTTLNGNTSVSGSNTFTVGTGATSLGGTLGVTGATTLNGNTSVSGTSTLTVGTGATNLGGTLTVAGASTFNGNVNVAGTNTLTVGTGATTLGGTLAVTGASTLTGQLNANGGIVTNNANINAGTGTITSGNINGQTISSAANFTGSLTVQGSGGLTLGVAGTTPGSLVLATAGTGSVTLSSASQSNNVALYIPVNTNASDTICLQNKGNCSPVGGAVGGSGTTNYLARFTGTNTLGVGTIFDNGTSVSVGGSTPAGLFNVGSSNQFQVSSAGAVTAVGVNSGTGSIQGTGGANISGGLTVAGTITLSSLNTAGVLHTNASGVVSTGLIVNGDLQAGAFNNITGTGTLTSGAIASGFGSISTGNNITTTANIQGAALNATGSIQLNGVNINTAGTLTNVAYLNQNNLFTARNTFRTATDSQTAFDIQDHTGYSFFTVDTLNGAVSVNDGIDFNFGPAGGGGLFRYDSGSGSFLIKNNNNSGQFLLNSPNLIFQDTANSYATEFSISNGGQVTFQNFSNSATALQVKNQGGNAILTVDTSGSQVVLGKSASIAGKLVLATAGSGSVTISSASQSNAVALSIPANTNTTDIICLKTLNNCAPSGGAIGGTGTANYVARFTGTSTLGTGVLYDNGTGVSVGGSSPAGLFNVGGSNQFQVSSTGAVTAVGVNSGTGSIQGSGGLSLTGGNFSQTGTGTFGTGAGAVSLNGATSVTGSNTFSVGTGATTLGGTLAVTGAPTASATASLVQIGSAIATGNSLPSGGTYIGLNAPSSGQGSAADFLNFQVGGNSKLRVTNTGAITAGGQLTVSSGGIAVTGNSTITGTLSGLQGLTVASGGASITGNSTITGTLTGLTGLTVASGGANITGGLTSAGTTTLSAFSTAGVLHNNASGVLSSSLIVNNDLQAGTFGNITGTGTLTAGAIGNGFGVIDTANNITTSATVQGATVTATGALQGNTLSINSGAFAVANTGAITAVTGITTTGGYNQSGSSTNSFSGTVTLGAALTVNAVSNLNGQLNANSGIVMSGNFSQTGTGTFSTGTGAISLNGNTSVTGTNTFSVGTGLTQLGGNLTVAGTINTNTFTSTALTFGGAGATTISAASNQNLTVQTQGTGQLFLGSANGTIGLTAATTTLQRTASGTLNMDLNDSGTTTLTVRNSGAGVAHLNLFDGGLQTAGTLRLDNTGNLSNIGTYSGSGAITLTGAGGQIGTSTNGATLSLQTASGNIQFSNGAANPIFGLNGSTGAALFRNSTNSGSALQVVNSTNTTTVFVVDTSNTRVGIGTATPNATLEVNSGTAGVSGLRFTQLTSNSTAGTTFSNILGLDANGNVGLSSVAVSLTSPALAYWDGLNNPTVTGQSYPLATLTGNAVYDSVANGIRLTPATGTQNGSVNWNFAQVPFEHIQYQMKTGGGTGADGTWFYSYADGVPSNEYGSGLTKGYIIYFSEYHDCVGITYGSYTDGNQCVDASSVGDARAGTAGYPLAWEELTGIDDNQWHDIDIQILYNKIIVRADGNTLLTYSDSYTRDTSNLNFGFGARTGGSTNNHYIKGLLVTKLGTNVSDYYINTVSPLASDLYWDNTNERLGVGNATMSRTLDVTGTWGGNVSTTATSNSTATSTIATKALAYYVQSTDTTGDCNTGDKIFNITGLNNVEGSYAYIVSKATDSNCTSNQVDVTVQINGSTIGTVTAANTVNGSVTENYTVAYINGAWRIVGLNSGVAQGANGSDTADFAEWIPYAGNVKPEPGEVLAVDGTGNAVRVSNAPYDKHVIGVVSTTPYQVGGADDGHSVILALNGRVPVKVSLENGPIVAGDPLTASSIPGVAMKATAPGKIIGTALGVYDGTQDSSQVMVQLGVGYNDPGAASGQLQGNQSISGNLTVSGDTTLQGSLNVVNGLNVGGTSSMASLLVNGSANVSGDLNVTGAAVMSTLTAGGGTVTGNLSVLGTTTTNNLIVTGSSSIANLTATTANIGSLQVQNVDVSGDLTVHGALATQTITVNGEAIFKGDIKLAGKVNTRQATIKRFKASKPITAGSVVILDTADGHEGEVTTTTAPADLRVIGVAVTNAANAGDELDVAIGGWVQVRVDTTPDNGNPPAQIKAGQLLSTGAGEGTAKSFGTPTAGALLGKTTDKQDANNLVWMLITLQ